MCQQSAKSCSWVRREDYRHEILQSFDAEQSPEARLCKGVSPIIFMCVLSILNRPSKCLQKMAGRLRQILEDADHLIGVWNERQAKGMPTPQ